LQKKSAEERSEQRNQDAPPRRTAGRIEPSPEILGQENKQHYDKSDDRANDEREDKQYLVFMLMSRDRLPASARSLGEIGHRSRDRHLPTLLSYRPTGAEPQRRRLHCAPHWFIMLSVTEGTHHMSKPPDLAFEAMADSPVADPLERRVSANVPVVRREA
jgi:hypothetical protein